MGDPNFTWTVDVTGVSFFKPGSFERLPLGVHTVKINSMERTPSKTEGRGDNVVFGVEITEGAAKGKKGNVYIPYDLGDPDSVPRQHLKNVLTCVVKDPSKLEGGPKSINAALFVGKTAYIYVQHVEGKDDRGRDKLPNVNFVPPDMAKELRAAPGHNGAAGSFKVETPRAAGSAPQPTGGNELLD